MRLPHFTKIEIADSRDYGQFIAASFRGKVWAVQPYESLVQETDIINYIRNIKSHDYKISNKIIISLKGIEENAKLLAKELKISIWDISALNTLFNIYGKRKVII